MFKKSDNFSIPLLDELITQHAAPSTTIMSTRADRATRASHKVLPIKVKVRQADGSKTVQVVDADVRVRTSKVEALAKEHLFIDTLETRKSDSLDFHDVSVWGVKNALEAAYEAGRLAGSRS